MILGANLLLSLQLAKSKSTFLSDFFHLFHFFKRLFFMPCLFSKRLSTTLVLFPYALCPPI